MKFFFRSTPFLTFAFQFSLQKFRLNFEAVRHGALQFDLDSKKSLFGMFLFPSCKLNVDLKSRNVLINIKNSRLPLNFRL